MWENENEYRKYACLCLPLLIHILSLCDVTNRDENLSVWISSLQRAGRRRGDVTIPPPPISLLLLLIQSLSWNFRNLIRTQ